MNKLNERSCLLDSFAYLLDVLSLDLAERVGHFGSEGYHSQELIEAALQMGYSVTAIERSPMGENPKTGSKVEIRFKNQTAEERFGANLRDNWGVLLGETPFNKKPHAVCWMDPWAHDPASGEKYGILDIQNIPTDTNFIPSIFLRVDKL